MLPDVKIERNPKLRDEDINKLFLASWPDHREREFQKVLAHSLTYIAAWRNSALVGFINVAWDGGLHGFILDTTVHPELRRRGLGLALVEEAVKSAREAGLTWLHVDFDKEHEAFYRKAGFKGTGAGLMRLT